MADREAGNRLEKKEQKKNIAVNTLYTMGGLIFMNAVLQIVITPLLNRVMGAEQLGGLLYITGLIAIVCPSVGQALNTSRLLDPACIRGHRKRCRTLDVEEQPGRSCYGSRSLCAVYVYCISILW